MRIFQVYIPGRIVAFVLSEAVLIFSCFAAVLALLGYDVGIYFQYEGGSEQVLIATALFIGSLYFRNLYSSLVIKSSFLLIREVIQSAGVVLLVQAIVMYVYPPFSLPQTAMVLATAMICVLVPIWRVVLSITSSTIRGERILILGTSKTVLAVAECLAHHPEFGYICGFVEDDLPVGETVGTSVVVAPVSGLRTAIDQLRPDRLVVGMRERRNALPVHDLLHLRFSGLPIEEAAGTYERVMGRVAIHELNPSHLIYSSELGPNPRMLALQMVYSIALAAVGLILTFPLMLVIALLVRLTSRGPILFRQERVGLHGKPFVLYKFRSMVVDAEAGTGAVWAQKNDPRVTALGKWLRKLRLDELPQLINVIRGQMALVGPRPERPEFVKTLSELIPFYPQRHYVRPGITGWAQINYKYGDQIEDTRIKLEYDLYYLKNMSMTLDFYCMFHTLKVMLLAEAGQ